MLYSEIVDRIRKNERIPSSEITLKQLIMLYQDREIENVRFRGEVYELNVVPITYSFTSIDITDELSIHDFNYLIENWIKSYKDGKPIYINMEDEYFEIVLDLMETEE